MLLKLQKINTLLSLCIIHRFHIMYVLYKLIDSCENRQANTDKLTAVLKNVHTMYKI